MALVPHQKAPRRERNMFTSSDDTAMMKQILATHAPDGHEFSVKPLLHIVEDIFLRATPVPGGITNIVQHQGIENIRMIETLSYSINKIACEMSCKCSGGGDAHATTVAIFNLVSNYSWDEKVVLALAGFAVNYGEFCLVAQLTNPLAKAVALLKQLPDMIEPKFEALTGLIRAMMEVAKCIVEFKELPSQYITPYTPEMLTATAHFPTAVYWTIKSIVACASQIMGLTGMGHELSNLAHEVNDIHSHLKKQLAICIKHKDEQRHIQAFQTLKSLFEDIHIDNMKILNALFYAKDDQPPLFYGSDKKRASLDVLREKSVLLLISDIEFPHGELSWLKQKYSEAQGRPYEVVWLPIVGRSSPWNVESEEKFKNFQETMPWYSFYNPSLLDIAVIRYIEEVWHFNKKPILVVLDQQGKVVNPNAVHMMWIWGNLAFPFTSSKEEQLWKKETSKIDLLDLLGHSIIPMIQSWIKQDKYICLYGGEDMDWIRIFTTTAKQFADKATIQLEMLYVGKSNCREKVGKNIGLIQEEELSHVLLDLDLISFFWMGLESMLRPKSKVQHKRTAENDTIMQEIMTMLSFDGSDQGWAVISKGPEMAKAKGDTILKTFEQYNISWRANGECFLPAMNEYLNKDRSTSHCYSLILPGTTGNIQEVVCANCYCSMEKFIMYRCCKD